MSAWRQLSRGLRALWNRSAADRDVADEVQSYLDEATAAHAARGLSPEQARRAARLELGSVTSVREQVREYGWENTVETTASDLRYAARRLRGSPGFTAIVVFTLALGIGGTTAIFSAVNPILLRPLSYPDAGRLVMVWETQPNGKRADGTFGMYRWFADRSRAVDAIAVVRSWQPTVTGTDDAEQLVGQRVSASYFTVLGVPPAFGRDFEASDDRPNDPNVVILSDALWRRRFAGDRAVVGRPIALDGASYTVIGVMPPDFGDVLAPAAELWAPLQFGMSQGRAWGHQLRTVARLRPAASVAQASLEIDALGQAALNELRPETYGRNVRFVVTSLGEDVIRAVRPTLLTIMGAVVLVLVIAGVNVTNLLLGRGVHRRAEFALRTALGAGRGRMLRQLLTESLMLAAAGGIVGMAVAALGVRALVAISPAGLARADAIRVDGAVLMFGIVITTLIGLAVGVIPAVQAARADPQPELQRGSRRLTGGHYRMRRALVVVEIALALMLLVGSGLLFRSLQRLFAVPLGFDASQMITMQVQPTGQQFKPAGATAAFFDQVLDAVRRVPGVIDAGATNQLPMSGDRDEYGVQFDSDPKQRYNTFRYAVSPHYLETMRIPLRSGRAIEASDRTDAPLVALVSESLATRAFPGASPIGQRLQIGGAKGFTVVGVVGDLKQISFVLNDSDAVYVPASQWPFADRNMSIVIRTGGDAAALAPAVRQAVRSVDRYQPILRVATMDTLVEATAAERRFVSLLFQVFALSALVLAAAGVYGVLAGAVAERAHEIGVRAVLGASRTQIVRLVVQQGLRPAGVGAAIGLAGAAALSRVLERLLFRISPLDPVTFVGVAIIITAVAVLACSVPAWRAARVDPANTLRST